MIAGKLRGKTPVQIPVRCAATQIQVRHARYTTWTKTVRPSPKGVKVTARLERPTFTVKVSSVPSGAASLACRGRRGRVPAGSERAVLRA